jgi:hypothetical protein
MENLLVGLRAGQDYTEKREISCLYRETNSVLPGLYLAVTPFVLSRIVCIKRLW